MAKTVQLCEVLAVISSILLFGALTHVLLYFERDLCADLTLPDH